MNIIWNSIATELYDICFGKSVTTKVGQSKQTWDLFLPFRDMLITVNSNQWDNIMIKHYRMRLDETF